MDAYKGYLCTTSIYLKKKKNKVIIMKVKQSLLLADYITVYILYSYIIIAKFCVFRNIRLSSGVSTNIR